MTRTLYRSRTDRMVFGVCGGLAEYFDLDPTVVRLLAVVAAWLSGGVVVLVYIVMGLVVPEEPLEDVTARPGPYPYPSPRTVAAERRDVVMTDDNVGDTAPMPEHPAPEQGPAGEQAAPAPGVAPGEPVPPEQPVAPPPQVPPAAHTYTPPAGYQPPPSQPPRPAPQAPPPEWDERRERRDDRRGGLIGGLVLIVIGGLFLLQQFVPGVDIGRFWPLILIVIGLAIIFRRR
jgi:phage shock protein PspC (stress-responsive transcriptional regulator)